MNTLYIHKTDSIATQNSIQKLDKKITNLETPYPDNTDREPGAQIKPFLIIEDSHIRKLPVPTFLASNVLASLDMG